MDTLRLERTQERLKIGGATFDRDKFEEIKEDGITRLVEKGTDTPTEVIIKDGRVTTIIKRAAYRREIGGEFQRTIYEKEVTKFEVEGDNVIKTVETFRPVEDEVRSFKKNTFVNDSFVGQEFGSARLKEERAKQRRAEAAQRPERKEAAEERAKEIERIRREEGRAGEPPPSGITRIFRGEIVGGRGFVPSPPIPVSFVTGATTLFQPEVLRRAEEAIRKAEARPPQPTLITPGRPILAGAAAIAAFQTKLTEAKKDLTPEEISIIDKANKAIREQEVIGLAIPGTRRFSIEEVFGTAVEGLEFGREEVDKLIKKLEDKEGFERGTPGGQLVGLLRVTRASLGAAAGVEEVIAERPLVVPTFLGAGVAATAILGGIVAAVPAAAPVINILGTAAGAAFITSTTLEARELEGLEREKLIGERGFEAALFIAGARLRASFQRDLLVIKQSKETKITKLDKIKNLFRGAQTEGERVAARNAFIREGGNVAELEALEVVRPPPSPERPVFGEGRFPLVRREEITIPSRNILTGQITPTIIRATGLEAAGRVLPLVTEIEAPPTRGLFLGTLGIQPTIPLEELTTAIPVPRTAVGTRVLSKVLDLTPEELTRISSAQEIIRVGGTERGLTVREVFFNIESFKNKQLASRIIDQELGIGGGVVFGSATTQQLPDDFQVKLGDVDVLFPRKTEPEIFPIVETIARRLSAAGENVEVSPKNPLVIQTKEGLKIFEAKAGINPTELSGDELAGVGGLGFDFPDLHAGQIASTVRFGRARAITIGEQLTRKGVASIFFRPGDVMAGELFQQAGVFPRGKRGEKDIADFIQTGRGITELKRSSIVTNILRPDIVPRSEAAIKKFLESFTPEQQKAILKLIAERKATEIDFVASPSRFSQDVSIARTDGGLALSARIGGVSPGISPGISPTISPGVSPIFISPRPSPIPSPIPSPTISPPSPAISPPSPFISPPGPIPSPPSPPPSLIPSPAPSPAPSPVPSPFISPAPSPIPSPRPSPTPSPFIVSPPPITPTPPPPPPLTPFIDTGRPQIRPIGSTEEAYILLLKKKLLKKGKGKKAKFISRGFKEVAKGLSREEAIGLGMKLVDIFTQRSFKVKKKGTKLISRRRPDLLRIKKTLENRFRQAKRNKEIFVEKSKFAISSLEEKKGIPFEAARLRKRKALLLGQLSVARRQRTIATQAGEINFLGTPKKRKQKTKQIRFL